MRPAEQNRFLWALLVCFIRPHKSAVNLHSVSRHVTTATWMGSNGLDQPWTWPAAMVQLCFRLCRLLWHSYNWRTEPSSSDSPREDASLPGGVGGIPPRGLGAQRLQEDVEEPVKTDGQFSLWKVISQEPPLRVVLCVWERIACEWVGVLGLGYTY